MKLTYEQIKIADAAAKRSSIKASTYEVRVRTVHAGAKLIEITPARYQIRTADKLLTQGLALTHEQAWRDAWLNLVHDQER